MKSDQEQYIVFSNLLANSSDELIFTGVFEGTEENVKGDLISFLTTNLLFDVARLIGKFIWANEIKEIEKTYREDYIAMYRIPRNVPKTILYVHSSNDKVNNIFIVYNYKDLLCQ